VRELNGHNWGGALQEGDHYYAQDMQVGALIFSDLLHTGRERAHQSVAKQDSEKCADQDCGNFVSDLFWRAAEGSHGDDDAKYGGDNSEARQGVSHAAQGGDGQTGAVVVGLHVKVQKLVKIKRFHSADCHSHSVAEVIPNVVIFEEGGIFGEKRTLGRVLDVTLQ
jgi:hypothetical protein